MLECADRSLYTGWTTDLTKRLETHNSGLGAKYTRSRLPVRLVAHWQFATRSEAMKFELKLKALSRKAKSELVDSLKTRDSDTLPVP